MGLVLTAAGIALGLEIQTVAGPFVRSSDAQSVSPLSVAHRSPDGLIVHCQPHTGAALGNRAIFLLPSRSLLAQNPGVPSAEMGVGASNPLGFTSRNDVRYGWYDPTPFAVNSDTTINVVDNDGVKGAADPGNHRGTVNFDAYTFARFVYDSARDRFYDADSSGTAGDFYAVRQTALGGVADTSLFSIPLPCYGLALSPDRTEIAVSDGGSNLRIYNDLNSGAPVNIQSKNVGAGQQTAIGVAFGGGDFARLVLFTADRAGVTAAYGLYVWDRDTDAITEVATAAGGDAAYYIDKSLHSGADNCVSDRGCYLRNAVGLSGGTDAYLYRVMPPSGAYFHTGYGLTCQETDPEPEPSPWTRECHTPADFDKSARIVGAYTKRVPY